jgi:hypothetical protein
VLEGIEGNCISETANFDDAKLREFIRRDKKQPFCLVGALLKMLEETGSAENTLVIFTSEQGAQLPGCKWTNWTTWPGTPNIWKPCRDYPGN